MKPALVAVVVSLTSAFLACLALLIQARRATEMEHRLAALEATLATERPRPAEAPPADATKPLSPQPGPSASPATAHSAAPSELAALQAAVARLEQRVRELSRVTHASIEDEIAGITPDDLWNKYQFACRDNLNERAEALMRAFLKRFPNDPHAPQVLLHLGKLEQFNGDFVEGRRFYEQLLRDFPDSLEAPYALIYLARNFVDAGDLTAGTVHYEKAVEALKGQPYWQACALFALAETWKQRGQPEVAKEYYRKVATQVEPTGEAKSLVEKAAQELKALEGR